MKLCPFVTGFLNVKIYISWFSHFPFIFLGKLCVPGFQLQKASRHASYVKNNVIETQSHWTKADGLSGYSVKVLFVIISQEAKFCIDNFLSI